MVSQGEVVKVGDRVFSPEEFAKLPPERLTELKAAPTRGRNVIVIREAVSASDDGMTASEVIASLNVSDPDIKDTSIYSTLSRLTKDNVLIRGEDGRYRIVAEHDRTSV